MSNADNPQPEPKSNSPQPGLPDGTPSEQKTTPASVLNPSPAKIYSPQTARPLGTQASVRKKDLAITYRSLAEMLGAGVSITRSLDTTGKSTNNPTLRRVLTETREQIEQGSTLSEALAAHPHIFLPLHCQLLSIAEQSGRLEPVLRELANYVETLIEMQRVVISGLIFPALILHVAAFIVPLPEFIIANLVGGGMSLTQYLFSALTPLILVWGVAIGGTFLVKNLLRTTSGSAQIDKFIRPIPILGITWRELDYWRVASGMEMMINAGLGVIAALHQCATFCRSPKTAQALKNAALAAEAGGTVSISLAESGEFPDEMVALWGTGEESGRLDEMLAQVAKTLATRCQNRMRELARWAPRIIYAMVCLYLILNIFKLAMAYVGTLNSFME